MSRASRASPASSATWASENPQVVGRPLTGGGERAELGERAAEVEHAQKRAGPLDAQGQRAAIGRHGVDGAQQLGGGAAAHQVARLLHQPIGRFARAAGGDQMRADVAHADRRIDRQPQQRLRDHDVERAALLDVERGAHAGGEQVVQRAQARPVDVDDEAADEPAQRRPRPGAHRQQRLGGQRDLGEREGAGEPTLVVVERAHGAVDRVLLIEATSVRLPEQDRQAVRSAPGRVEAVGCAVELVERGPQRPPRRLVERVEAQLRMIGEAGTRQRRLARGGDQTRRSGGGGEGVDEARLVVGGEAVEVVEQPQTLAGGEAARDVAGALLVLPQRLDGVARELAADIVEQRRGGRIRHPLAHDGARPLGGEGVCEGRFADAGHAHHDRHRHLGDHFGQPRQLGCPAHEDGEARGPF